MEKSIFLCGFMGSGKTTVGQELALFMGRRFYDLDDWVIQASGMAISDVFARYGEDYFRNLEHTQVTELAKLRNAVAATGGGTMAFSRNIPPLRENGVIVYLNPGFDACFSRIQNDLSRPVAQAHSKQSLQELFERRHPMYENACDFALNGEYSTQESAALIAGWFNANT